MALPSILFHCDAIFGDIVLYLKFNLETPVRIVNYNKQLVEIIWEKVKTRKAFLSTLVKYGIQLSI